MTDDSGKIHAGTAIYTRFYLPFYDWHALGFNCRFIWRCPPHHMLALYNDRSHNVEVFVDQDLWESESFQCHPLVNTATLEITRENLIRFLEITGHEMKTIEVPGR